MTDTAHTDILAMIEAADPSDAASLDEIDARVWAYLKLTPAEDFKISFNGGSIHYRHNSWPDDARTILHHMFDNYQYTRSRDALKQIRPEGWMFFCHPHNCICHGPEITFSEPDVDFFEYESLHGPDYLPTEELAELHAIIQAIAYERE